MLEDLREKGGAEVDLDELVSKKVLLTWFPVHSTERSMLSTLWAHVRIFPCSLNGEKRRFWPDLGLLQQYADPPDAALVAASQPLIRMYVRVCTCRAVCSPPLYPSGFETRRQSTCSARREPAGLQRVTSHVTCLATGQTTRGRHHCTRTRACRDHCPRKRAG